MLQGPAISYNYKPYEAFPRLHDINITRVVRVASLTATYIRTNAVRGGLVIGSFEVGCVGSFAWTLAIGRDHAPEAYRSECEHVTATLCQLSTATDQRSTRAGVLS
jgi:hypothetical protein